MLEVSGVRFAYPGGNEILKDITLSVKPGRRVAIVGANGSGKTTLARLMCGLLQPAAGTVVVDGYSSANRDAVYEVRRRVGLVFQDPDDQMVESTVAREVAFGLRNLGLEMDEVATRTDRALEVFGIEHLRTRPCHLLSAGEKQLVAVASIFTMEPAYVILDEATSLLDSVARRALLGAVGLLLERTGSGLVFITMRVEDVWMCEEIVHLEGGGIGFRGGKQAYLEYLSGRDLPLYGLALLVREIAKAMPDFARNVSECGRLDPDCIAGTLLRLGPAGGD